MMNSFSDNQSQYKVLDNAANSAVISLYPELNFDKENLFIKSDILCGKTESGSVIHFSSGKLMLNVGFYITQVVNFQNVLQFDIFNISRCNFFCSIMVQNSVIKQNSVNIHANNCVNYRLSRQKIGYFPALYKIVGRMRL